MSTVQVQKGGIAVPAASRVATDQSSILGDGSIENPLRTNGAGGPTIKVDVNSIGSVHLGTPVCVVGAPSTEGAVCTVTKASGVSSLAAAQCIGLIVAFNEDGTCQVQTGGTVTLTTVEWTVIASPSGGLVPSETYYLDASGLLADVAPGTPGNFSSQVGVALTAESLLLSTPSVPLEVA